MITICPKCGRLAPRLIEAGTRTQRICECPRCAYPTQRIGGRMVEMMPDADLEWYGVVEDADYGRSFAP